MSNKEKNYEDYQLNPDGDVLVPIATYVALNNLVQVVEQKHSNRVRSDKYAYFHKETHKRLSNSSRSKMDQGKLDKEYYENIDFEATGKNVRVDRDDLGSAAIRLIGELRGIFRYNIDQGNGVLRSEVQNDIVGPAPISKTDES